MPRPDITISGKTFWTHLHTLYKVVWEATQPDLMVCVIGALQEFVRVTVSLSFQNLENTNFNLLLANNTRKAIEY